MKPIFRIEWHVHLYNVMHELMEPQIKHKAQSRVWSVQHASHREYKLIEKSKNSTFIDVFFVHFHIIPFYFE